MEIKHTEIEGNPLVNRVELHDKDYYFLVVTGNYNDVSRTAKVYYMSPRFNTLGEAEIEYNHRVTMQWRALPASQFERGNDLIYTFDYIAFYMEDGIEIKNVLYLMDIQQYYAKEIISHTLR